MGASTSSTSSQESKPALEDLAGIDFGAEVGDELVEWARAQVALRAVAHGDGTGLGFLAADDQHVGNLFELGVAGFGLQLFVAIVQMRAEARVFQFLSNLLRVLDKFSAYRQHGGLHGCQPRGKCSGVVLDQHAEESLDRAEQRAMHHQRLVARTVLAHVFELESRRQIEIELHGGELPGAPDGIHKFHVDLRAVKGGFAGNVFVGDVHALQRVGERSFGALPVFGAAGIVLRPRRIAAGKLHFVTLEAENAQHFPGEFDAILNLFFDLIRHAKDVRVVLSESAHGKQTVQYTRTLVAIHGAQLGQPHGKLAVAAQLRLVNQNVARTVHGLELVVGFFDFDRAKHIFAIKVRVAAGLPQFKQHDVGGENEVVAAVGQLVAQPVFHLPANDTALGMPENQARAGFLLNAEKIKLLAQLAVIAALGFFQLVEIFVQILLFHETGAVNPLHLRIAFLAFPIRAGHVH